VAINERYPDLTIGGRSARDLEVLQEAIVECWQYIDQAKIDSLFSTMHHRMQAVVDAQGWYTKY